jgi:hypothetical protein
MASDEEFLLYPLDTGEDPASAAITLSRWAEAFDTQVRIMPRE